MYLVPFSISSTYNSTHENYIGPWQDLETAEPSAPQVVAQSITSKSKNHNFNFTQKLIFILFLANCGDPHDLRTDCYVALQ